jgi:hypothetical protein
MERRASEEAYEFYRLPAWREGYAAGRLQGLLVLRGVVSNFFLIASFPSYLAILNRVYRKRYLISSPNEIPLNGCI